MEPQHSLTFSIWFGYVLFVVYGSLVPLDFNWMPFDQAWQVFQHIQLLKLGIESRADWIANGVLYVPLGFLTAYLLLQKYSETNRTHFIFLAGLFSIVLAVCIEFTQIYFPPRSVSLNDLLAESIGSFIGLMLATKYSDWFNNLLQAGFSDPRRLTLRLVEAYLIAYVAFSFFPYDLLLSGIELENKIRSDSWGWLLAGGDNSANIVISLKSLSEIALTLPFGLMLGYRSLRQSSNFKQAILLGVLLGGVIEIGQFFTASGVSQGISVLTRVAGICGGVAFWRHRTNWSPERIAALIQRFALPLGSVYLLILLYVNGWFSHRWNGLDFALSKWDELHFMPFYYHYFTTEAKALFSLASVCLMYLPIGLLSWSNRDLPPRAFFFALLTASLVETGKLFLQGMRPDPTNIVLGAFASWGMVHLAYQLTKAAGTSPATEIAVVQTVQSPMSDHSMSPTPIAAKPEKRWITHAMFLPLLAFTGYWAATFPTQPVLLCMFLTACGAIIWHRPALLIAIITAALPVFDLAPWSGRFYLDEFDLLLIVSISIGYIRTSPVPRKRWHADTFFVFVSSLVAISFAVSAMRGLFPWQTLDANAFTNYYSPFNALRISKGVLFAFLIYGLLRRMIAVEIDVKRPLTLGMVTGLALTDIVILWERITFGSLLDFVSDYRVTGPFSSMHTGGAYIECFLAVATPFLILLILQTRNLATRLFGVLLLPATTYALMVTFSRNGYLAFAIALAIVLFFALFESGRWQRRSIFVAVLTSTILAVAIPVITGQFAQERLATSGKDFAVRKAHWKDALNTRSPDWLTSIFGMGLGRYPESHYLFGGEGSHTGTYQLKKEGKNSFVRLGGGDPIYLEQIVTIEPNRKNLLKLDLRSSAPNGKVSVSLCEKWMLTSFNCVHATVNASNETDTWSSQLLSLPTGSLGNSPWYATKPVKLGLHSPPDKSHIDIDNVRLETTRGENLLLNSDFSKEMDHWFFSADNHLQWHTKSLPVAILFDQGWFGLIALGMFSILAVKRAVLRAWKGNLSAASILAAFCAFLVVGLFDTLIDAPRFLFLFLLLGLCCGNNNPSRLKERHRG